MAGDSRSEYKGKADEYFSKSIGRRFQIIFAGPLLNYLLGFLFFWCVLFIGYPSLTSKVGGLIDGYGAKEAGLEAGDKIVAVDGRRVDFWDDMYERIQNRKSMESVEVDVLRSGKELKFRIPIRDKVLDNELGEKRALGIIGITPFDEVVEVRHGFFESAYLGLRSTVRLTAMTYKVCGCWLAGESPCAIR
jgi:regulator of sigma E protease